jgi:hypothetical protein
MEEAPPPPLNGMVVLFMPKHGMAATEASQSERVMGLGAAESEVTKRAFYIWKNKPVLVPFHPMKH